MRNIIILTLAMVLGTGVCFADTHIPAGDVFGVWEASGSPYYIDGEIHVPTDSMLRIEPGCSIIFTGHYQLCIDSMAMFKAVGTVSDSILFTAEDTIEGWFGLRFLHSANSCSLLFSRVEYSRATGSYPNNHGGGIYCYRADILIENNTICKNSSNRSGGGIYCHYSSCFILNNSIKLNKTNDDHGGGIYCYECSPIIEGNVIIGNEASDYGGGIYCYISSPIISNNTISNNVAGAYGGGIASREGSNVLIFNTILWNNESSLYARDEIYIQSTTDSFSAVHCNFDSTKCTIGGTVLSSVGNINENPLFADTTAENYHLLFGSPCIDEGAESLSIWETIIYAPVVDIEGNPRPLGDGWDIGAYEFNPEYVKEIPQKSHTFSLTAFPNPFNSSCAITAPAGAEVEIYDLRGNKLWERSPDLDNRHQEMSPTSRAFIWQPDETIASGIYLVRARTEDGGTASKRVVYLK